MITTQKSFLLLSLLLFLLTFNAHTQESQDSTLIQQKVKVTTTTGDIFLGILTNYDPTYYYITTEYGELKLDRDKVKKVKKDTYQGAYSFGNPNATRYFFAPTGVPIQKDEGYYQNIYVTVNMVNYGVSNNFSMGGGIELITLLSGNPVGFLSPKIGFKLTEKLHTGGGVFLGGSPNMDGESFLAGIGYWVITYGTADANITAGAGYLWASTDGETESLEAPLLTFSGMKRVSRSIALVSENYIYTGELDDTSPYKGIQGIRIMSQKNTFDIGLLIVPEITDEILGIPYLSYVRYF
ncbi:hypothetical protein [Algivirga pacifica]|uniref:MetA-pathway of phenol degradation n=1 Tax=Algivirga pacifica TaxID=1162670 RepID=A0ABP9D680_9BACT